MARFSFLLTFLLTLALHTTLAASSKIPCMKPPFQFWKPEQILQLSEREMLVTTIYENISVFVDPLDKAVSKEIRYIGFWEARNLRVMSGFVKEGDHILNAGSHIGLESVVLGKMLGPKGKLFVFEPVHVTYRLMRKNMHLNGLDDIATTYNIGCYNKYKRAPITVPMRNTANAMMFGDEKIAHIITEEGWIHETIETNRLDFLLPADTVLNFALIDVERLETECLEGFKETIRRSPDFVLTVEWAGVSFNSNNIRQKQ